MQKLLLQLSAELQRLGATVVHAGKATVLLVLSCSRAASLQAVSALAALSWCI